MVSKASSVKNGEHALAVAERCWRCEVRSVQHSLGLCCVGREEKAGEMVGADQPAGRQGWQGKDGVLLPTSRCVMLLLASQAL